ncbi:MAG: hypothetical protein DBY20_07770 [Coriobacteriia bacterium]|nr:MAG: hypothetical protein DBY20_07770 [Coriobacteriia bacterium]
MAWGCVMTGYDIGSEIEGVVRSLQRNNPDLSATARVKRAWNLSVDKRIAEHVTAVFVVPNTAASEIIVYVDSSIWATELNMQSELLRLNLNIELNKDADEPSNVMRKAEQVEKLTFKVSKEQYAARDRRLTTLQLLEAEDEDYRKAQPVALDEEELSGLEEALSHIENDQLRDTAYAAAKANLEWQKGVDSFRNQRPA